MHRVNRNSKDKDTLQVNKFPIPSSGLGLLERI